MFLEVCQCLGRVRDMFQRCFTLFRSRGQSHRLIADRINRCMELGYDQLLLSYQQPTPRRHSAKITFAGLAVGSALLFLLCSFLSFLRLSLISPLLALRSASSSSRVSGSPRSRLNLSSRSCSLALRSEIEAVGGSGAIWTGGRDEGPASEEVTPVDC